MEDSSKILSVFPGSYQISDDSKTILAGQNFSYFMGISLVRKKNPLLCVEEEYSRGLAVLDVETTRFTSKLESFLKAFCGSNQTDVNAFLFLPRKKDHLNSVRMISGQVSNFFLVDEKEIEKDRYANPEKVYMQPHTMFIGYNENEKTVHIACKPYDKILINPASLSPHNQRNWLH